MILPHPGMLAGVANIQGTFRDSGKHSRHIYRLWQTFQAHLETLTNITSLQNFTRTITLTLHPSGRTGTVAVQPSGRTGTLGGIARYIYHSVFGRFFSKILFNLLVLIFLDYFLVVYDRKIHFQA